MNVNRRVSMVTGWLPTISRNWMLGTSIAVCLAILFLPSICDETYMPAFLTLSVHHKVIAAYVLGKLCMMSCSDFCCFFLKKYLEDISPFCGAPETPVLDLG